LIIHIPLDDRRNVELRNPDNFIKHIDSIVKCDESYVLMIDEVQMMDEFVEVLNSLLYMSNVDVYVTGSNSKFLSSDIVTEFRGRGDEIHMYPLSFSEYYSAFGGDRHEVWKMYYTYGGLPQVALLDNSRKKMTYLENLMSTVFMKDILERHKVKNETEIDELTKIIASSIGSSTNPTKLSKTFKSLKNIIITNKTVSKYLGYLVDAFLIEKAVRYNIKGKKYINTLSKFYFTDLGLRNATLEFRQLEETHLMENAIYNELLMRGYSVDVGMVEIREKNKDGVMMRKQLEVDFVANSGNERYYIQSALSMPDEDKKRQETASFRSIDDSFKKIIIVRDDIMPYTDNQGYRIVGLFDFLLNKNLYS
ncbi:MAG: ATP-binding protein, partial [Duncaniella sp.]|nr:ATP-binding protein [Duncaniella sp.]